MQNIVDIYNRIKRRIRKIFLFQTWGVGIVKISRKELVEHGIDISSVKWIETPDDSIFNADPFILDVVNDEIKVIYEVFDFENNKGMLNYIRIQTDGRVNNLFLFHKKEVHISYPYVIKNLDKTYILPEQKKTNKITLYEVDNCKIVSDYVLIDNIQAADPSIIRFQNKWWMFALVGKGNLYIWYSNELFSGWIEHENNPVKVDNCINRPAGSMFVLDNELYRPVQDSSDGYGKRIFLMKISELSKKTYKEDVVQIIETNNKQQYPHGIHTLSLYKGYAVVDGKKEKFITELFLKKIKNKFVHKNFS